MMTANQAYQYPPSQGRTGTGYCGRTRSRNQPAMPCRASEEDIRESSLISTAAPRVTSQVVIFKRLTEDPNRGGDQRELSKATIRAAIDASMATADMAANDEEKGRGKGDATDIDRLGEHRRSCLD